MRSTVILCLLLVTGWAHALTFSPMNKDTLVYTDLYVARFKLKNTSKNYTLYDVWLTRDSESFSREEGLYEGEEALGGNSYKTIKVPVMNISPDVLEKFYVCVQEKTQKGQVAVVGRACAKLRLYWPQAELRKLQ